MVNRVEYITPAVKEKTITPHLVRYYVIGNVYVSYVYFLLGSSQGQANHPARIDELSPNIDWLGSELLDHLVQHEGVAGAGEGVHGHTPAGKSYSLIVQLSTRAAFRILEL